MRVLQLLLRLRRVLREPVERRLEVPLRVLAVLLCGVPLLLEELKLAVPEGLVSVVGVVQVLVLQVQLRELFLLTLHFLLD